MVLDGRRMDMFSNQAYELFHEDGPVVEHGLGIGENWDAGYGAENVVQCTGTLVDSPLVGVKVKRSEEWDGPEDRNSHASVGRLMN